MNKKNIYTYKAHIFEGKLAFQWCRFLGLFFLFLLLHGESFAQSKYNSWHNLSLHGKYGIHSFMFDMKNSFVLEIGGGMGVSYDYYFGDNLSLEAGHFGIGTGLELGFLRSSYRREGLNYSYQTKDSEDENFIFNVYMQSMEEVQQTKYLYVPLLFKMRFDIFSMGLGVKAGFPISNEYRRNIRNFKTTGLYPDLHAPLENIPEYGFITKANLVQMGDIEMQMDWVLTLDIGVSSWVSSVFKESNFLLYLGAYVEYGLQNLKPQTSEGGNPLIRYSNDLASRLSYASVLEGQVFENDRSQNIVNKMNSFCFGVKLAFSFGL